MAMGLSNPGPELGDTKRRGDDERILWVEFNAKGGTSDMEVGWKKDLNASGLDIEEEKEYIKRRSQGRGTSEDAIRALRGNREKL